MSVLERCDGPPCPRCGCQDSDVLVWPNAQAVSWFASGRGRCRHCRLVFSFRELPQVLEPGDEGAAAFAAGEPPVRLAAPRALSATGVSGETKGLRYPVRQCPHCQSTKIRVTTTRKPLRHHKCDECKKTFKSVERDENRS